MLNKQTIAVVIPAHNEAKRIGEVIKTMPLFVDDIIVVDDASADNTISEALKAAKKKKVKLTLVKHTTNQGVGAAIVSGYARALKTSARAIAVMAGDAQMDPTELKKMVMPIIKKEADYTKGNRLIHNQAWKMIPKVRYLGNAVLSMLTKIASGYWHVADSQTGYTVISKEVLSRIALGNLYKRYGFPNDLLVHLNIAQARVKEVPIEPIYHVDGKSGIRLWKVIPTISWLLMKRFFWRLKVKYIIQDFHPLIFFYIAAFLLIFINLFLLYRLIEIFMRTGVIPSINALALVFCILMSTQFTFFAMWMDMDYNKDLKVK